MSIRIKQAFDILPQDLAASLREQGLDPNSATAKALLKSTGYGAAAGTALGGAAGLGFGSGRGQPAKGTARGAIKGLATGAGAGAGLGLGTLAASHLLANDHSTLAGLAPLLGAVAGGGLGYGVSSKLIDEKTGGAMQDVHMTKQEAVLKMAAYIEYLAGKIPVGTKAAQVSDQENKARRLTKLATCLMQTQDIFQAVKLAYPRDTDAYRHRVVTGLLNGFRSKLAQAMQKRATHGSSKHPSAAMGSSGPLGPSGTKLAPSSSQTSKMC